MTKEQQYELLKVRMVKTYSAYINAVQQSVISDLDGFDTRLPLLDTYIESVKANAALRDFINKHKGIKILD